MKRTLDTGDVEEHSDSFQIVFSPNFDAVNNSLGSHFSAMHDGLQLLSTESACSECNYLFVADQSKFDKTENILLLIFTL